MEKNEMGGACSTYEGKKRCVGVMVGNPEEKRPIGRPKRRWENNIKTDLQKMGCGGNRLD